MKFIVNKQEWKDAIHYLIMESNGVASCRLSFYPRENVQVLSSVYVDKRFRENRICSKMLDFVDNNFRDRHTLVYIDRNVRDFIRNMYSKRGYIILVN